MHGPRINPAPNNPLLSTLKRKVVTSNSQSQTKKKIESAVVNIPDMDGVLVGAFEVFIIFSLSFLLPYFD
jgi:hypothetical protein